MKNTSLTLRITQQDKILLKKLAHRHEMNVSQFIRFKTINKQLNN